MKQDIYILTYQTPVKGKIKTVTAVKKKNKAVYNREGYRTITGRWFYEGDFLKAEVLK